MTWIAWKELSAAKPWGPEQQALYPLIGYGAFFYTTCPAVPGKDNAVARMNKEHPDTSMVRPQAVGNMAADNSDDDHHRQSAGSTSPADHPAGRTEFQGRPVRLRIQVTAESTRQGD